jgi:hypothetical protein
VCTHCRTVINSFVEISKCHVSSCSIHIQCWHLATNTDSMTVCTDGTKVVAKFEKITETA